MDANVSCTINAASRSCESHTSTAFPSSTPQPPVKRRAGRSYGPARPREQIIAAIKAYVDGELMDDIAARFGVTQPTVTYWVNKYGVAYGGPKFIRRKRGRRVDSHPNSRDMAILFKAIHGKSFAAIGREFGLSRARVAYIIKTWEQRGFVTRPPQRHVQPASDMPALSTQPSSPIPP